jgi:hypothetical protein
MKLAARPALKIDVLVDSDRWNDAENLKPTLRRAVARAAATVSTTASELAIVLTDDSAIRRLNREWRGVDAATNVLSFPNKNAGTEPHLGDIVLAFETIASEAAASVSLSPITSPILPCTDFCICSATTTKTTAKPARWKNSSGTYCGVSPSRIPIGQELSLWQGVPPSPPTSGLQSRLQCALASPEIRREI